MLTRGIARPGQSLADKRPDVAADWHPTKNGQLTAYDVYSSEDARVWWQCPSCSGDIEARVRSRKAGALCKRCAGAVVGVQRSTPSAGQSLAELWPLLAAEWCSAKNQALTAFDVNPGTHKKVWWQCTTCTHIWCAAVNTRTHGHGCPRCADRRAAKKLSAPSQSAGWPSLQDALPRLAAEWHPTKNELTAADVRLASHKEAWWICDTCQHDWLASIKNRSLNKTGCPRCARGKISGPEVELLDVVQQLVPEANVLQGDRQLLDGLEVDIYIPEKRVAVEFNGLYWHSVLAGKDKRYHAEKSDRCAQKNVTLVHVWEDDWQDHEMRVKLLRLLAHKLGATDRLSSVLPGADIRYAQTVYARKTTPVEISSAEARKFIDSTHLQGWTRSKRYFGLQYQEQLCAVLAISPSGRFRYSKTPGYWEIVRFSTVGSIPGGFTKLLKHAERVLRSEHQQLLGWETFSSAEHSTGAVYRAAGFSHVRRTSPSYWYYGSKTGGKRAPMHRFQRHIFEQREDLEYQLGWTESQAAAANGLIKIWGLPQDMWKLTI